MKKTLLSLALFTLITPLAMAQDHMFQYVPDNSENVQSGNPNYLQDNELPPPPRPVGQAMPMPPSYVHPHPHSMPMQPVSTGVYQVQIGLFVNDELYKVYKVDTNGRRPFIIVNAEDIPYVKSFSTDTDENGKRYEEKEYGKAHNGILLKGQVNGDADNSSLKLALVYNNVMNFSHSCLDKNKCIDLPNQILSVRKVDVQTPYGTDIQAFNFQATHDKKITVNVRVIPLPPEDPDQFQQ